MLVALLEPNVRFIGERRREFLDRASDAPDDDRRVVVEALVRPVSELAERGWRERAFLRIGLDVADHSVEVGDVVTALVRRTAGAEAYELLAARSPELDDELLSAHAVCVELLGRAASQRARLSPDDPAPQLSCERSSRT